MVTDIKGQLEEIYEKEEKKKIHKFWLERLRDELMEAAVDEDVLKEEQEMLNLPFPHKGTLQEAHMNSTLHLIFLLKRAGEQEEVDRVLAHYEIDPFFRLEKKIEELKELYIKNKA